MKRLMLWLLCLIAIPMLFSISAGAEGVEQFDNEVRELEDSLSDEVKERMESLGCPDTDIGNISGISLHDTLSMISDMIADSAAKPLASAALMLAVILLSSLLESYTFSLRYVDTKDVMNVVTSLMLVTALVTPIAGLIQTALDTVKGAASLMLIYVPLMVGIMAFSGHIVQSGGYYATVMTASEGIAQLSSVFLAPLLNIYLAISVSSAISERVKLSGICEMIAKVIKWTLTFAMTVFTAILSVQSFAAGAADSAASKAVRFTLSSFIPVVGASVSEAYRAIGGSLNLLRSGLGVFVIIAMLVTFLPLIVQILLWQFSTMLAKTAAQTFGVSSAVNVLGSISTVLSVLTAIIVTVMSVFLISTGALLAIGGGA